MALHPRGTDEIREGLADALDWVAVRIWSAAHRLRPVYNGPMCPDCGLAPDPGPDVECETCRQKWEAQLAERVAYERDGHA